MPNHPTTLTAADAVADGAIRGRIAELAARRHTYQAIANTLSDEFGLTVSRDMVRRWLIAEGIVTPRPAERAS